MHVLLVMYLHTYALAIVFTNECGAVIKIVSQSSICVKRVSFMLFGL